jgi:tRNA A-37 threonylcarbamoyl transferase component Bud32
MAGGYMMVTIEYICRKRTNTPHYLTDIRQVFYQNHFPDAVDFLKRHELLEVSAHLFKWNTRPIGEYPARLAKPVSSDAIPRLPSYPSHPDSRIRACYTSQDLSDTSLATIHSLVQRLYSTMQRLYYIRESSLSPSLCRIKLMRGNTQFYLTIPSSHVRNTPLGQDFLRLINEYHGLERHDTEAYDRPLDLICSHFLPLFEKLARQNSVCSLTLQDFVHAPTYWLDVFGTEIGDLNIKGEETRSHTPAYDIAPLSISSAPSFWRRIPKSQARELSLVLSAAESNPLKTVQGKVRTVDGSYKYFKPRQEAREGEFTREVQILSQIKEKGLAGAHFRLPVLDSLVMADAGEEAVVGILMNLITAPSSGCHLLSPGFKDRVDLHQKWEQQVRTFVQILHSHDLVWGDVNPCNVAIDEDLNAWIIDFGGMNNAEFVDDDKAETKEGDWQGVERLFGIWLPSRVS